jgi:beta-lactamase regulating signal transducer with metallopeptidase domain
VGAEALQALIVTAFAGSAAILVVRLLRKPLRAAAGARAAYGLWILVPAMALAVLLPAPSPLLASAQVTLPPQIRSALAAVTVSESTSHPALLIELALILWVVGAGAAFSWMLARQRAFVRSLGTLTRDADGLHRSSSVAAPLVIGAWRSKIVVPADFEFRYSSAERVLVVAHERAHAARHDVAINMLASCALCLWWFNPLMYRALAWLRIDQELACDALVLARSQDARQPYADALLKSQLAAESASGQPIGCHWQSAHPLKERISMLKRPLPGLRRRLAGLAFIVALTGIVSYATWAGQAAAADDRSILIDLKVTISSPQTHEVATRTNQYLVRSGEAITSSGDGLDFACTPLLADAPGYPGNWSDQQARGIPRPQPGQILLDCAVRRDGTVVERPAVIVGDGKSGIIETSERGGPHRYRIEITAATSLEKIAAARELSGAK